MWFLFIQAWPHTVLKLPLKMKWKRPRDLPFAMSFPCSVVVQGRVYVGGGVAEKTDDEHSVMVYKQGEGWKRLPRYRYRFFAMAVLQDQLTLVGGEDSSTHKVTNQISVLHSQSQRWTYPYPPLSTRRFRPGVATYTKWLVVVGGENNGTYLNSVEIMNTTNKQWFTATPLPMGCSAQLRVTTYLLWSLPHKCLCSRC